MLVENLIKHSWQRHTECIVRKYDFEKCYHYILNQVHLKSRRSYTHSFMGTHVTDVAINNFPTLVTSRLKLRAVTPADSAPFRALLSIPEVTRYSNWPDSPTEDQVNESIRNMSELFPAGNGCAWIIEDLLSSAFIGAIRFNYFQKAWKVGGVGYEAHPNYWGRDLMTEALRAVVACGHVFFDLNRIEAWTLVGNGASDRVLEKAGFQFEGIYRQKGYFKGAFHDFRMFSRVADDPI